MMRGERQPGCDGSSGEGAVENSVDDAANGGDADTSAAVDGDGDGSGGEHLRRTKSLYTI